MDQVTKTEDNTKELLKQLILKDNVRSYSICSGSICNFAVEGPAQVFIIQYENSI